ncbi:MULTISPECIES: type 1 glutamine amidotransferase domain-containing protein [Rubritalea]|nr:type 1 glutamine amidotransferase domain-containing protein [Rubritalea squalenifaciens]
MMKKSFFALILLCGLSALLLPQSAKAEGSPGKILMVVTNHAKMPNGKATGFWLAEVTHPWARFTKMGFGVDFASPKGGLAPIDPRSKDMKDADNKLFMETEGTQEALKNTQKLSEVDPKEYRAIFFAGGHGTMWDFPDAPGLSKISAAIYENDGVVAAVCHGPAALVNLKLSDGSLLIKGKKVTGFTNEEEEAVGLTKEVPFLLEDKLKEQGATFDGAEKFKVKVITSERLVTGQNPASAGPTADAVLKLLANLPLKN